MERDENRIEQGETLLQRIVGARLSSVVFVLNYLVLGFGPEGDLTTRVWPRLIKRDNALTFGMQGYRDGLCDLITHVVERVGISSDETITLSIENDIQLEIPLRNYSNAGERAIFTASKRERYVW